MGADISTEHSPEPVILHVYDLGTSNEMQAVNVVLSAVGTGAFHCGVEVYGKEWSFNATPKGSGVFHCKPRECASHTYRESVLMGHTMLGEEDVMVICEQLKTEWKGISYNMLTRNCCNFCDLFCRRLGVGSIPFWTSSLAGAGAAVQSVYKVTVSTLYPSLLVGCITGRDEKTER
uniref:PPPDE domain-containing protein n=1 Tax=Strombidinopsis acuminata TaxID=141414 RepID=A0A7S3WVN0_9SPIT